MQLNFGFRERYLKMSIVTLIFALLGGLAIFLYGLQSLSGAMQEMAGKNASRALEILTSIPIFGMLFGALVTIIVQSSTLVTVMVVSLVNTKIMTLKQAAAVIMGANIGTTLTAQLVAFRITDMWVYFAAVGFIIFFFAKPKHIKNIGISLFAFALLLLGLSLMSDAMRPLRTMEGFHSMMQTFSDFSILGMLAGAVFTAVIQSSTAATGVIVTMTMDGLIDLNAALPLILGANVGTCLTAVLASIGTTPSAKRAATIHVIFNFTGALIFLIFLRQFEFLVLALSPAGDITRQAANAHTLFSVITTVLFLPFINQLVKLVEIIIPDKEVQSDEIGNGTMYLDWKMVKSPAIAMELVRKELLRMAELAGENIDLAMVGLLNKKRKKLKKMKKQEKLVDKLELEIAKYLTGVSQHGLSGHLSVQHAVLLHAANDIERVSDHANNIAKIAQDAMANQKELSRAVIQDVEELHTMTAEIYQTALIAVRDNNKDLVPKVKELSVELGTREKELRAANFTRITEGDAESAMVLIDIIANFERIVAHSINITHLPQGKL